MLASFYNAQKFSLYLVFFLLLLPLTNSLSLRKTRFESDDTSIIYEGGAFPSVGGIDLNSDIYQCQVGRASYAENVLLWDSKTHKLSDFTTRFSVIVDIQRRINYSSGFTFFLAPVEFQVPPNSAAGFLGLYNITTMYSSSYQVVHFEFDSDPDPEWDPPYEHVGINVNSLSSATFTRWNTTLHSGDAADVSITYNGTTKNMSVSWKYQLTATSQETTSLSYVIDLREVLPPWVKIGFSGSTKDYLEKHSILSWEFSSTLETEENNFNNDKNRALVLFLVVSVAILIGVLAVAFGVWHTRKLLGEKTNIITSGLVKFSYSDLVSATGNFSSEIKLGGAVYKGYLSELNKAISVKKIEFGSKQERKEFITEFNIIRQLRHQNLLQLRGWCHEESKFLLVYENMPNGTLCSHLFGNNAPITWAVRYRIALELASALLYLHEEWEQCVLHSNIKSSNIMLDSNFNARLCDFLLARVIDHDPEYISTGNASKESDVYGFGVIVLEIVTGRNVIDPIEENSEMSLVEWVWDHYRNRTLNLAVDKRLCKDFDEKQMECLLIVGLWCAHPVHSLRPSIRQAIHVLNFDSVLPFLPTI